MVSLCVMCNGGSVCNGWSLCNGGCCCASQPIVKMLTLLFFLGMMHISCCQMAVLTEMYPSIAVQFAEMYPSTAVQFTEMYPSVAVQFTEIYLSIER